MSAAATIGFRLDYEAKWFLPVPGAFPEAGDASAEAWIDRVLREHEVMPPWRDPALDTPLRRLMAAQQQDAARRPGAVVLWYCPFGLPASAVVEIAVEDREGRPADLRSELDGLRSELPIRPMEVQARGLGRGVGYARVLTVAEDEVQPARIAELGYVFAPDGCAVAIRARSADAGVVGLLSGELWRLVDSVVLS